MNGIEEVAIEKGNLGRMKGMRDLGRRDIVMGRNLENE